MYLLLENVLRYLRISSNIIFFSIISDINYKWINTCFQNFVQGCCGGVESRLSVNAMVVGWIVSWGKNYFNFLAKVRENAEFSQSTGSISNLARKQTTKGLRLSFLCLSCCNWNKMWKKIISRKVIRDIEKLRCELILEEKIVQFNSIYASFTSHLTCTTSSFFHLILKTQCAHCGT